MRKPLLFALLLVAVSSTAWAQPQIQVTGLFGYTVSDGVNGKPHLGDDGKFYNRIDPKDGVNFGLSAGVMVKPNVEVGFMYRRQVSKFTISGDTTKELGELSIDGYHGYFTYYFGEPEAKVNPYFLGGLGATDIAARTITTPAGRTVRKNGGTEFSSVWGAGLRFNVARHFAVKAGVSWTPTYIKSNPSGYWCSPYWGCYVVENPQYMNQFHFEGGLVIHF